MTLAWFDLERARAALGGRRQRRGAAACAPGRDAARRGRARRSAACSATACRACAPRRCRSSRGDVVVMATDGIDGATLARAGRRRRRAGAGRADLREARARAPTTRWSWSVRYLPEQRRPTRGARVRRSARSSTLPRRPRMSPPDRRRDNVRCQQREPTCRARHDGAAILRHAPDATQQVTAEPHARADRPIAGAARRHAAGAQHWRRALASSMRRDAAESRHPRRRGAGSEPCRRT